MRPQIFKRTRENLDITVELCLMPASLSSLGSHLVGMRFPEFAFKVSPEWVTTYKQSLGFAESEVNNADFVPQSFVAALRDSEFAAFSTLGIDLRQLLHTNQVQKFLSPIRVGDTVLAQATIQRLIAKRGKLGDIVFIEFSNLFRRLNSDRSQTPLVDSTTTVVVRALDPNLKPAPDFIRPMGSPFNEARE